MRGSLLSALLVSAANAESSLLQGANTAVTRDRVHSKPLAGLLESAKSFLANGATPDTVAFVNETLKQVAEVVIPAIVDESEEDKKWMEHEHEKFDKALTELNTGEIQIRHHRTQQRVASMAHSRCRREESRKCNKKCNCETEMESMWKEWEVAETQLVKDHDIFRDDHFCKDGANGTLQTFRDSVEPSMTAWIGSKQQCDKTATLYNKKVEKCDKTNKALDDKSAECNTKQSAVEASACAAAQTFYDVMTNFHTTWPQLHASYQGVTDLIYQQTQDRKQEHTTLKVVECLLRRVHQQNGRPCDEHTNSVTTVVGQCEQEGLDLDSCKVAINICTNGDYDAECPEQIKDICPDYKKPPIAPGRSDPEPYPCGPKWIEDERKDLPILPQEPFTAENPGCNAYPPCLACPGGNLDVTVPGEYKLWIHPTDSFSEDNALSGAAHATFNENATKYAQENSLRAAAVDGCGEDIDPVMKYTDDTAAVRCCSSDEHQDPCVSPGAPKTTGDPNTCDLYTSVTFHDAVAVCDNLGMRLCTNDETATGSQCCGTGCGFDHKLVWISDAALNSD